MPPSEERVAAVEESASLRPSAPASGWLARQSSLGTVLALVIVVALAIAATSVRQAAPSSPPAGAVGVGPSTPGATEPPGTWIAILPSPEPSQSSEASTSPTSQPSPGAVATPWRTTPPTGCQPYVKACDPSMMPVYPYVAVIITTGGSTDADLGVGKVTVVAAGQTYSCTTYSTPSSCYYEVPPGTPVTATAYNQAGSMCTSFALLWEDYSSTISHDDCSPISFTTQTQKAQLTANFNRLPPATPVAPTEPPPPPLATSTPASTAADSPVPS